ALILIPPVRCVRRSPRPARVAAGATWRSSRTSSGQTRTRKASSGRRRSSRSSAPSCARAIGSPPRPRARSLRGAMSSEGELLRAPLGAVVVGPQLFASALGAQGVPVRRVDWQPPSGAADLGSLWSDEVDAANRVTLDRILAAHQVLIDVRPAIEVVPGMTRQTVLHAGPPIAWERMSGRMRGGIVGALIYEGLATTWQEAERLVAGGAVRFDPCHHHATVGPMAGATTASMPVLVVENRTAGNRAYSTINEGLGRGFPSGPYVPAGIDPRRWFPAAPAPPFAEALGRPGAC